MHVGAEPPEPRARVTRRPLGHEFRHHVVEQDVFIVQPLERDEAGHERAGLGGFDAGRQQEQHGIEIVLLRHHAVFPQILRHNRRRHAMRLIFAGHAIEARR